VQQSFQVNDNIRLKLEQKSFFSVRRGNCEYF